MAASLTFECGGRPLAEQLCEEICALHDAVFSDAPFEWVDEKSVIHRRMLTAMWWDPAFGIVVAKSDERLVGVAYGCSFPDDHSWWDFPNSLSTELRNEWAGRTFALITLAVDKMWRGRGIGKCLLDTLLKGRNEERAALSVEPEATATQEIYVHLGWEKVGRKGPLAGVTPPYWDIFLRTLR